MYLKKVQIETTNNCNLKCNKCLREKMTRNKGFISMNTFINSLRLCKEFGIEVIRLHNWGEPLLHPKIINFIKLAKTLDFEVGFTTNGTLLTHNKLSELKKAGLDKLDISYNINRQDKYYLKVFYNKSNNLGIDTWFRSVVFSKEEYNNLKDELNDYNVRFQRGVYFDFNKKRDKPCKVIENQFVIQWNGVIVPCCVMYNNQYIYGRIKEITVNELRLEINKFKLKNDLFSLRNCCNHCFEIDINLPLDFKL